MTEHPPTYQTTSPTALDNLVAQRRTETSVVRQANSAIYELLLSETVSLLHSTAQLTQDAILMVCVEHNARPQDVLTLVHDFLATFQAYQQHEAQPEPEEASPFIGREASADPTDKSGGL